MPNFDGKGPAGQGAKTGAQMGDCEGANSETVRPMDGRGESVGRGRGMGRGQGGRRGFWARFRRFGRGRQE